MIYLTIFILWEHDIEFLSLSISDNTMYQQRKKGWIYNAISHTHFFMVQLLIMGESRFVG